MRLNLLKDSRMIREYIRQRALKHRAASHHGPGKKRDPISQITMGYQFDQAGWVALVFDTRPDAQPDGEWNTCIAQNAIEFPHWWKAYVALEEKGASIEFTLADGTRKSLGAGTGDEEIAAYFGAMLQEALRDARQDGDFAELALAEGCILVVEEHDGRYGWSDQKDDRPDTSDSYLTRLASNVASKDDEGQIAHWIQVLDRVASGKESESSWSFLAPEHAIKKVKSFGARAIIPMLKWVRKWSGEPEFRGDRPKRKLEEMPMQTPAIAALMMIRDSGSSDRTVETFLREILRKSMQANATRKLWGIMPIWTARCLHRLFQYPEPRQDGGTNRLLNPDDFIQSRPNGKSK